MAKEGGADRNPEGTILAEEGCGHFEEGPLGPKAWLRSAIHHHIEAEAMGDPESSVGVDAQPVDVEPPRHDVEGDAIG